MLFRSWSDVDGMLSADPRIIKEAQIIEKLGYDICKELSAWGSQVIHPYCIDPCKEKNIPIIIKNTFNPSYEYNTVINGHKSKSFTIYSIVNQKNNTVYKINTQDMWHNTGFASSIFNVFAEFQLDINIITTDNFSISLTTNELSKEKKVRTFNKLNKLYDVKMIENCSIVSIVADNILENEELHKALSIIKESGEEHLHITHYNTNNLSVSYVVDSSVAEKITKRFHMQFIIKKMTRVDNENIWWRRCNMDKLKSLISDKDSAYV